MNDIQNISQDDIDDSFHQTYEATPYTVNMEASFGDFDGHVSVSNRDFKENVLKKVQMIKLEDTSHLNMRVEELKS